ncbi:hypothetical protein [Congregibacter litoralis]|uniref:Uncharacterized protein n=1 Tax=Congregibacter litoralis KT71 TaxID=314285 RepID=A4ACN6_9GAMM|nr:hypothetical protein [Congregibacter litoralis]EAQ96250.1 hypothetical protein KT71_19333 [Congregibacter litoralis KT71]
MLPVIKDFLASGHAAELILVLVCCEFLFLSVRYWRGVGSPPRAWLSPLMAGAFLVIALRLAQSDAPEEFLGLALAAAGIAHLMGYGSRWHG